MKIVVFLNDLGLGGSGKAACRWSLSLAGRGHSLEVLSLGDGPRRASLESSGIPLSVLPRDVGAIRDRLEASRPDVIHAHVPGYPHFGDMLGEALQQLPKIPLVQTNIFGRLENPREDRWTDFRLFISWTSGVQAARRAALALDGKFFRRASVAAYPLDQDDGPPCEEREKFRRKVGVAADEILFGRLSRPDPNKWTGLPLEGFRLAARRNSKIKLLLREPPPAVRHALETAADRDRFIVLPATGDEAELRLTMASLDAVLHTSIIGESFGYGIAEPMNYGKPVIANSTPWQDQAQIELVRHGLCGFIASTPWAIADAILRLANDFELRAELGRNARTHIRKLADVNESTDRLENALRSAISGTDNPFAGENVDKARAAANYLDEQQFGHTWREQIALRQFDYRVRFHEFRKTWRTH